MNKANLFGDIKTKFDSLRMIILCKDE